MTNFDKKATELLRNSLSLVLYFKLKRKPTEDELLEELMCLVSVKTDLEMRANGFPDKPSESYLDLPPAKSDMQSLGYWPPEEYE